MVGYGNPLDRQRRVPRNRSTPLRKSDLILSNREHAMRLGNSTSQETPPRGHRYHRQSARSSTAPLPPKRAGAAGESAMAAGISECHRAEERSYARSKRFHSGPSANRSVLSQEDRVGAIVFLKPKWGPA